MVYLVCSYENARAAFSHQPEAVLKKQQIEG